jgi:hypothetical protein
MKNGWIRKGRARSFSSLRFFGHLDLKGLGGMGRRGYLCVWAVWAGEACGREVGSSEVFFSDYGRRIWGTWRRLEMKKVRDGGFE